MRTTNPLKLQRIIDTAAQLFAERHYHEVRMDDIASQAGVAKGTLYLHFRDKEDLYLALILNGSQRLFEEVRVKIADARTAEEKLLVFVREFIGFYERYPYFLELSQRVDASRPDPQDSPLEACRVRFLNLLIDVLRAMGGSGRYHVTEPYLAALALRGMTREILRFHPRPWPRQLSEWIVRQFLQGISQAVPAASVRFQS